LPRSRRSGVRDAGGAAGAPVSYALAKVRGLPLLYKGADFGQTDIASAMQAE
jgi:ribonuclease VapC